MQRQVATDPSRLQWAKLVILALLNLVGVKASAEASAIFAVIAGVLQLAVVVAVIARLGPAHLGYGPS